MEPVSRFPPNEKIESYWISFSALISSSSRSEIVSGCGDEDEVLYINDLSDLLSVAIWVCVVFECSSRLCSSLFDEIVFVGMSGSVWKLGLFPVWACSVWLSSTTLSPFGEFDKSRNINCVSVIFVVCCWSGVLLTAFTAFSVLIFLTILAIFFVELLNSNTSFVLLALLLSSEDVALSGVLCVRGLIEVVSMKSVGSLFAMISYESLFVGSALTLNIWIDGGCGVGVLKMRRDLFVSVSNVIECSLREEAVSDCLKAACFAFSLKLWNGVLCLLLGFLPALGCLSFDRCCSFWPFVAILRIFSFDHLVFAVSFLFGFFLGLLIVSISDLGLFGALFVDGSVKIRDGPGSSWIVLVVGLFPVGTGSLLCFACLASSKQNFLIFSWFLLYSPIVFHATMWINRGFVSGNDWFSFGSVLV